MDHNVGDLEALDEVKPGRDVSLAEISQDLGGGDHQFGFRPQNRSLAHFFPMMTHQQGIGKVREIRIEGEVTLGKKEKMRLSTSGGSEAIDTRKASVLSGSTTVADSLCIMK